MSDTSKYEIVKQEMDIRSYLDYFCANMYLANAQYGQEEACIWRTVSSENGGYADGRWRWVLGSMDMTMDNGTTGPGQYSFHQYAVTAGRHGGCVFSVPAWKRRIQTAVKESQLPYGR